ncbi:MAG: SPFH domain-containing protein [Patescibacteria group bacterium]|jgi:regulator of protease activity HflC (stomatin/prohibitin superfamily)
MTGYSNTRAVQSFIRFVAWLACFLLLGIITALLGGLSTTIFYNFWVLATPSLILNFWIAGIVSKMFFILPEWESMVLLRLGRFEAVKGAGFFIVPPFIYSVASIVDTRIETNQVEATNTLTKDNVPTKVTAALEFRVEDPRKAIIDVFSYRQSVIWLATEALKNTIGSMDLKELLSDRVQIALDLKEQIDQNAVVYGVDVKAVRITDIDTPQSLIEELAVIARARRSSEAKKIEAEAEVLVAEKIAQASRILETQADGMRLRELQVLSEMSKEESSMVIVYPYGDREGRLIANASAGGTTHYTIPELPKE